MFPDALPTTKCVFFLVSEAESAFAEGGNLGRWAKQKLIPFRGPPEPLQFLDFSSTMLGTMATKKAKDAFAVIATGGKQYVVTVGETLEVELLGEHKEGDAIEFDTVLMTDDGTSAKVGTPTTGTKVVATYLGEKKGPKLTIIRYKAKSNRDRRLGHRQHYAQVKIESIA